MTVLKRSARGLIPAGIVALVLAASYFGPAHLPSMRLASTCSYGYGGGPNVTGVSPTSGTTTGGTTVTITGCGFTGATSVHFGTTAATSFTVNSDSQITATSPAHAAGTVDVTVTTPLGTSALSPADQFTYAVMPCTSVDDVASPPSPATIGTTVVFTATAHGCPNPRYEFWILSPGASSYTLAQGYSNNNRFTWSTGSNGAGTYAVTVWARDTSSSGTSSNSSGSWDSYNYQQYTLVSSTACPSVSDSASPPSPQMVGATVVFTASAGCPNPRYEFWTLAPGASSYTLAQAYSPSNTFTWNTTGKATGTWAITVWVKDQASSGTSSNSSGSWDAYNYQQYTLTPGCPAVSDSASPSSPSMVGTTVVFTASASGCPNPRYEFWTEAPGAGSYTLAQSYSSTATYTWSTSGKAAGTWAVTVWVKDASSTGTSGNASGRWDAYNYQQYTLTTGCPSVTDTASPASPVAHGTTVTFTASVNGHCANPRYEFWIKSPGASLYTLAQPYSTSNTFIWSTGSDGAGTYEVTVWVQDASSTGMNSNSSGTWDAYDYQTYTLS